MGRLIQNLRISEPEKAISRRVEETKPDLVFYTPNQMPKEGIAGFIDEEGLENLRWIERNLGGKIYIAAGKCPRCGAKQLTLYMNLSHTNCLECGMHLPFRAKEEPNPFAKLLGQTHETVDAEFEDVTYSDIRHATTIDSLDKALKEIVEANPEVQWPVIQSYSYWKRVLLHAKRMLLNLLKPLYK